MLWINKSKIQSESKSQRLIALNYQAYGCESISQRYNLKANHNSAKALKFFEAAVNQ